MPPKSVRKRTGFTLIEILVVCIMIGILGSLGVTSFRGMQENSGNAKVKGNLHAVAMALEAYRSEHDMLPSAGLIGQDTAVNSFLCDRSGTSKKSKYLEGNRLPVSPYGANSQGQDIAYAQATGDYGAVTAALAATGAPRPASVINQTRRLGALPVNTPVLGGPSALAGEVVFIRNTYGAIFYDVNALRDIYVIVGLGKRGRDALVTGVETNAN